MKKKHILHGLLFILMLLFFIISCDNPSVSDSDNTPETESPGKFKIVFQENGIIYTIDEDGDNQLELTADQHWSLNPQWSPDGQKIAYLSRPEPTAKDDIWVMNSDGSNKKQLTEMPEYNYSISSFAWSTDGSVIGYYYSSAPTNGFKLILIDPNDEGNEIHTINGKIVKPRWSPDGSKIIYIAVFSFLGLTAEEVYLADTEEYESEKLTENSTDSKVFNLAWSPDGEKIFYLLSDNDGTAILVMDADGENKEEEVFSSEEETISDFLLSPDGEKIAAYTLAGANGALWIMDLDGENRQKVLEIDGEATEGFSFQWKPDSKKLSYMLPDDEDNYNMLFVMDRNGENSHRIDKTDVRKTAFSWSPVKFED